MKIAILGTGGVGQAFAARLVELGHQVMIGTRNVEEKKTDKKFLEFLSAHPKVTLAVFSEAAASGEIIVNVGRGAHVIDMLHLTGEKNLNGKVLIDISNPLDFSKGMPPGLIPELSNFNSLGEEIQKQFPSVKVVKTLNTMWNGLMLHPKLIGNGDHINYICGNDADAKIKVISLLNEFGWLNENILDLGDITSARATEATLPIWLRVYGLKKTGAFNFNIVS